MKTWPLGGGEKEKKEIHFFLKRKFAQYLRASLAAVCDPSGFQTRGQPIALQQWRPGLGNAMAWQGNTSENLGLPPLTSFRSPERRAALTGAQGGFQRGTSSHETSQETGRNSRSGEELETRSDKSKNISLC